MSKVVDTVVDSPEVVDNQKHSEIGKRMKVAREALGLTQDGLATAVGGSKRGIQENEARNRVPGGEVIAGFVKLGINANWLLTGEGPMLLADLSTMARVNMLLAERDALAEGLKQALERSWAAQGPKINVDAMVQAIAAIFQVAPKGESVESLARKAVAFYQYCESQGLITPEGQGTGVLNKTA